MRHVKHVGDNVGRGDGSHQVVSDRIDCGSDGCPCCNDIIDNNHRRPECRSRSESRRRSRMVSPGAPRSVQRRAQPVDDGNLQSVCQRGCDQSGRVDPVPESPCKGSGDRHQRQTWQPWLEKIGHQPGVGGDAPILEMMDEGTGRAFVVERRDETEPTGKDSIGGGMQRPPASCTESARGDSVAYGTNHGAYLYGATVTQTRRPGVQRERTAVPPIYGSHSIRKPAYVPCCQPER